jgi:hypothetical protein
VGSRVVRFGWDNLRFCFVKPGFDKHEQERLRDG